MDLDGAKILDAVPFITVTDSAGNVVFQGVLPPKWYEGLYVVSAIDDDEPQPIIVPRE